jgi:hypothetical protein
MAYLGTGPSGQAAEQFKAALNLDPDGTSLKEEIRTPPIKSSVAEAEWLEDLGV